MRRKLQVLVLMLSISVQACTQSPSSNNQNQSKMTKEKETTVLEIAMFRVNNSTDMVSLNLKAIEQLSQLDGYLSSKSYQNISDENVYLDIVEWNSLEDAQAAQKSFEKSEQNDVLAYLSNIKEIIYFEHVKVVENGSLNYHPQDDNDILEFALFHVSDQSTDQFDAARINIMNHLGNKYNSFKEVKTVTSLKDKTQFIDIARWENEEQCHIAQSELESDPLFLEFMSVIEPDKQMIMEFFKKIR